MATLDQDRRESSLGGDKLELPGMPGLSAKLEQSLHGHSGPGQAREFSMW